MTQQTYRFIIDLNIGGAVAEALTQSGHDVLFVGDTDQRMRDVDILRLAAREQSIIVTAASFPNISVSTVAEDSGFERKGAHRGD